MTVQFIFLISYLLQQRLKAFLELYITQGENKIRA